MAVQVRRPDELGRRLTQVSLLFTAGYVLLVARLVALQVIQGHALRDDAISARSSHPRIVQAPRGAILDRNGRPLALTVYYGTLVCDPTKIAKPDEAAAILARVLRGDVAAIRARLNPVVKTVPVSKEHPKGIVESRREVILEDLSASQCADLRGVLATTKPKTLLQGIYIEDSTRRTAEGGPDCAQLVGLVREGVDHQPHGISGLERGAEATLVGTPGRYEAEFDRRGRVIPGTQRKWLDAKPGLDVRVSVDAAIQHIAATELQAAMQTTRAKAGTVVVIDPRTGDVLAMASAPTFDPANRSASNLTIEKQKDRAFMRYEPGSTMKAISIASALDDGDVSPSTTLYCGGSIKIGKRALSCAAHGDSTSSAHGSENPTQILEHSCNVCTAQIGAKMGLDRLEAHIEAFGLLDPAGLGLPADARGHIGMGRGLLERGVGKAARVAFGQSVVVTPMGMAYAYAALANGGVPMKPRLVLSQEDPDGRVVRRFDPQPLKRVVRPETARFIVAALEKAVVSGTGKKAQVPGYSVAGKTGTAQKVAEGHGGYASGCFVSSFIGMIPARAPRAVIAVVVDEPQEGHLGGVVAAPVFREVAKRLMWHLKVPPDKPETANQKLVAAE